MSRSNRIQSQLVYRGAARRSMAMPEPPRDVTVAARVTFALSLGVEMRERFLFGREAFAAIRAERISRKRGEALYVDKRRSESTAGSLAPFGTRRSASQHERRRTTEGARATRYAGRGWCHGSESRRRASAQIRPDMARAFFRCVGFAVTTNVVVCSGHRKGGWNGRKGV